MLRVELEASRVKRFWSQAVTNPPEEPEESTDEKVRRFGGRKDAALEEEIWLSFVSWSPRSFGFAKAKSAKTAPHLSESPSPLTFQDSTRNIKLAFIMDKTCGHRGQQPKKS
jgi:hypothetical protein